MLHELMIKKPVYEYNPSVQLRVNIIKPVLISSPGVHYTLFNNLIPDHVIVYNI